MCYWKPQPSPGKRGSSLSESYLFHTWDLIRSCGHARQPGPRWPKMTTLASVLALAALLGIGTATAIVCGWNVPAVQAITQKLDLAIWDFGSAPSPAQTVNGYFGGGNHHWAPSPTHYLDKSGLGWEGHTMAGMIAQIRKIIHKQPPPPPGGSHFSESARPPPELPEKCDKICQEWRATAPSNSALGSKRAGFNAPRVTKKSIPVLSNHLPPTNSRDYTVLPPPPPPAHRKRKRRFVADIYPLPERKSATKPPVSARIRGCIGDLCPHSDVAPSTQI